MLATGSTFKAQTFWLAPILDATDKADAESLVRRGGGTLHRGGEPGDAKYVVFPPVRGPLSQIPLLPRVLRSRHRCFAATRQTPPLLA